MLYNYLGDVMGIEYEVRVLDINIEETTKKLEILGAKKVGEWEQKRYVYDTNPVNPNAWYRLRTNGSETTLTYKNVQANTVDGTKELEIVVSDFDKTNELLELMGYINRGYQENKRIRYMLNGIEIDIDSWPMIPAYMEIEGKSVDEVNEMLVLLDVDMDKVTALNCQDIYKDVYNIDINKIKTLKF